jgi:serine protease AprX
MESKNINTILLISCLMIVFSVSLVFAGLTDTLTTDSNSLATDSLNLDASKFDDLLIQEANSIGQGSIPIIVTFDSNLDSSEMNQILDFTTSIDHEYQLINAAAFTVDVADLNDLAELSFIKSIEYDAVTEIVLAQSTTQIQASSVWLNYGTEGEDVTIAILDTGIDNEHDDLQNVISEQDFTGEGTDDNNGHGTHVASIAAGSGAESAGIYKGVAAKARLMDVKVLGASGSGRLSDTIAGIEWATLQNADIISMSLGAQIPCNGLDATSLAANAAVKRGVHVVVAAGNAGPLPGSISSPGCAQDVITVGSVGKLDSVSVFSSRGPTLDARIKPDIVAPGELIFAAKNGGGYQALSGTSMSTPHVSGAVALILSENPSLSPSQVKEILMDSSKDLGEDKYSQGAGRLDAYAAFSKATNRKPNAPSDSDDDSSEDGVNDDSKEKEAAKESAKETAKDDGHIDQAYNVDEVEEDGKEYYVVEGSDDNSYQIILVWVDADSGKVAKVETLSILQSLWQRFLNFFESIIH